MYFLGFLTALWSKRKTKTRKKPKGQTPIENPFDPKLFVGGIQDLKKHVQRQNKAGKKQLAEQGFVLRDKLRLASHSNKQIRGIGKR